MTRSSRGTWLLTALAWVLGCEVGCGRTKAAAPIDIVVTDVTFVTDALPAGHRGVLFYVTLHNRDDVAGQVVSGALTSSPEGVLTASVTEPLPYVAPGLTAKVSFVGRISREAGLGVVTVVPRFTVRDLLTNALAEISAPSATPVNIVPRGPTLVVNTTSDVSDLADGETDPAAAGDELSLREAVLLLNAGSVADRIEFDEAVFFEGSEATISVEDFPTLTRANATVDATGRSVTIASLATATFSAPPLVTIQAPDVELQGLQFAHTTTALMATASAGLHLNDVVVRGLDCGHSVAVLVLSMSDDMLIENSTLSSCYGSNLAVNGSARPLLRELRSEHVSIMLQGSSDAQILDVSAANMRMAVGLYESPRALVQRATLRGNSTSMVVVTGSDDVVLDSLFGRDCASSSCDAPLVTVDNSDRVQATHVESSSWAMGGLALGVAANVGAPLTAIEGVTETTVLGSTTAGDGARVELYEVGANWRSYLGETQASGGHWLWTVAAPTISTIPTFIAVATDAMRTGRDSLPARRLQSSLCPLGRSRFRADWEVQERVGWVTQNIEFRRDFAGPSGLYWIRAISSATPGQVERDLPIDLSGVVSPELRLWVSSGMTAGTLDPLMVSAKTNLGDSWVDVDSIHPTWGWGMYSMPVPQLASQASVYLLLTIDLHAGDWGSEIQVDTLEICEMAGF